MQWTSQLAYDANLFSGNISKARERVYIALRTHGPDFAILDKYWAGIDATPDPANPTIYDVLRKAESYKEVYDLMTDGLLEDQFPQEFAIVSAVMEQAKTAQEIYDIERNSGKSSINGITPRFSELADRKLAACIGARVDKKTEELCKIWVITNKLLVPVPKLKSQTQVLRETNAKLSIENEDLYEEVLSLRAEVESLTQRILFLEGPDKAS